MGFSNSKEKTIREIMELSQNCPKHLEESDI